jgi:hypothetical protein
MLKAIKEFFMGKPVEKPAEVPYKIEVPAPVAETATYTVPESAATTPIPLVVEAAPVAAKPKKPTAPKKPAAPKKAPAPKKQQFEKKPAAKKPAPKKAAK